MVHILVHTLLKNDPLRPLHNSFEGNSFRLHPDVAVAFQHLLGIEIFVCGTDNNVYRIPQDKPGGDWTTWESLGGPGVPLVSAVPFIFDYGVTRDVLHALVLGTDGNFYHRAQARQNQW